MSIDYTSDVTALCGDIMASEAVKKSEQTIEQKQASHSETAFVEGEPAHHARRPMNAFLIFCKRHRGVVRDRYPHLENRSITKILGEWWANLEPPEKTSYTELAKQYKEAFLRANPDFKWYKLPAPPLRTLMTRPSNQNKPLKLECQLTCGPITPGKLADESQMGGLSSLLASLPNTSTPTTPTTPTMPTSPTVPKPPKKRYLQETMGFLDSSVVPPQYHIPAEKSDTGHSWSFEQNNSDSSSPNNLASTPITYPSPFTKLRSHAANQLSKINRRRSSAKLKMSSALETTIKASQQQIIDRVVDRLCGFSEQQEMLETSEQQAGTDWAMDEEEFETTTNNNIYVGKLETHGEASMGESNCETMECFTNANNLTTICSLNEDNSSLISGTCDSSITARTGNSCDTSDSEHTLTALEPHSELSNDTNKTVFGATSPDSYFSWQTEEQGSVILMPITQVADSKPESSILFMSTKESMDTSDNDSILNFNKTGLVQNNDSKPHRTPTQAKKNSISEDDSLLPSSGDMTRPQYLRACKGQRYREFMSEGRLAVNKRSRRNMGTSFDGLELVPRRDRVDSESSSTSEKTDSVFSECSRDHEMDVQPARSKAQAETSRGHLPGQPSTTDKKARKHSETSEESVSDSSPKKRFRAADFNLDEKIEALPSLSLEDFQLKKKARKKRIPPITRRTVNHYISAAGVTSVGAAVMSTDVQVTETNLEGQSTQKMILVGSQKRKARKQSITRLDTDNARARRDTAVVEPDVLNNIGLATLAEVASAKSKLIK